jgi:hypothetical protein
LDFNLSLTEDLSESVLLPFHKSAENSNSEREIQWISVVDSFVVCFLLQWGQQCGTKAHRAAKLRSMLSGLKNGPDGQVILCKGIQKGHSRPWTRWVTIVFLDTNTCRLVLSTSSRAGSGLEHTGHWPIDGLQRALELGASLFPICLTNLPAVPANPCELSRELHYNWVT